MSRSNCMDCLGSHSVAHCSSRCAWVPLLLLERAFSVWHSRDQTCNPSMYPDQELNLLVRAKISFVSLIVNSFCVLFRKFVPNPWYLWSFGVSSRRGDWYLHPNLDVCLATKLAKLSQCYEFGGNFEHSATVGTGTRIPVHHRLWILSGPTDLRAGITE